MIGIQKLNDILNCLMSGDISPLDNPQNISDISSEAVSILNMKEPLDEETVTKINLIISISQLVYNNSSREVLFLEDGVYDLLLELDKRYNPAVQVGGPNVSFNEGQSTLSGRKSQLDGLVEPMIFLENVQKYQDQQLFSEDLLRIPPIDSSYFQMRKVENRNSGIVSSKKKKEVPHKYPKLVGTLDKCKFVLNKEAIDKGVFNDPNVAVFERDFLGKHLQMGLFDKNTVLTMVAEIKYDGISVEAEVTDHVISAYSRGDTANNRATDLTSLLGGYKFHYCPPFKEGEPPIGMKFEAMLLKRDVDYYSYFRGYDYANARNAMSGLSGASDGYDYRDLITLIPLATSIEGIDRISEIEFMNKYYHSGEYLRYAVLKGTYDQILYQVYRFEQEAEYLRPIMQMDYDGIVVSYVDPEIIKTLGRENFTNKYSIAIKFNPAKRKAVFTGYEFTVGQNGVITPMIHYTPVEFFGTIHDKSSGHSYKRFKDLNLRLGDILDIEYVNDVMPYVKRAVCSQNDNNHIHPFEFPKLCPACGRVLEFTEKSAICKNSFCPGKTRARVSNMVQKLGLKDFGSARLTDLGITCFFSFIHYSEEDAINILGEVMGKKFMQRVKKIKENPMYDYFLIGAIGFSNIAAETWKKILNKVHLNDFLADNDDVLASKLSSVRGVGPETINTIIEERPEFGADLICMIEDCNVIITFGANQQSKGKIRITGFRDPELIEYLNSLGYDASDSGVTKDTSVLLIPYEGFSSSKIQKAERYGVRIMTKDDFVKEVGL